MKRLFQDNQEWSQDGLAALRIADEHLRAAVEALVAAGYSHRDAGLVLHEQVGVTVAHHHVRTRHPRLSAHVGAFKAGGPW